MRSLSFLLIFCLWISVLSCGGGSDGGGGGDGNGGGDLGDLPENENSGGSGGSSRPARLVYDRELSSSEIIALDESTAAMGTLAINGGSVKGFSQAFGGNNSSNVVNYFERRVNYALSGSTSIDSRIISGGPAAILPGFQAAETVALNAGMALWLESAVTGSEFTSLLINDRSVRVNSSRVGIMQFGTGFTRIRPIEQVNTLVHEARHSDCTGGLRSRDIESWRAGRIPDNKSCGHVHTFCPSGDFAGELACDSQPWGAYAVGGIHSLAVARSCTNCSAEQKAVALATAIDSFSRLLYDPVALLEGRLGRPNMSSSTNVQNGGPASQPVPQPEPQPESQPEM